MAVDRTSKFAFVQLHEVANVRTAAAFLEALIAAVPYKIHTVLTDNGVQFCDMPKHRSGPTVRYRLHAFDRVCRNMTSNTASPSPITRGPTARSSA